MRIKPKCIWWKSCFCINIKLKYNYPFSLWLLLDFIFSCKMYHDRWKRKAFHSTILEDPMQLCEQNYWGGCSSGRFRQMTEMRRRRGTLRPLKTDSSSLRISWVKLYLAWSLHEWKWRNIFKGQFLCLQTNSKDFVFLILINRTRFGSFSRPQIL